MEKLAFQASREAWVFGEMTRIAKVWGDALTIASAVLSGLVGVEGLVTILDDDTPPLWVRVLTFCFSVISVVLLSINSTWKPGVVGGMALSTQVKLLGIHRGVKLQLALPRANRPPAIEYVQDILNEYERVVLGAPTIYSRALRRAEKRYGTRFDHLGISPVSSPSIPAAVGNRRLDNRVLRGGGGTPAGLEPGRPLAPREVIDALQLALGAGSEEFPPGLRRCYSDFAPNTSNSSTSSDDGETQSCSDLPPVPRAFPGRRGGPAGGEKQRFNEAEIAAALRGADEETTRWKDTLVI